MHFGGGRETAWVIDCDRGERGEKTDTLASVEARGGDISSQYVLFLQCNTERKNNIPRDQ